MMSLIRSAGFAQACLNGDLILAEQLYCAADVNDEYAFIKNCENVLKRSMEFVKACENGDFILAEQLYDEGVNIHIYDERAFIKSCKNGV